MSWIGSIRPLLLFLGVLAATVAMFGLVSTSYGRFLDVNANPADKELVIEAAKEFSGIATMLVGFCTGMVVLIAVVVRGHLAPDQKVPPGRLLLVLAFVLCVGGAIFVGVQLRQAAAYGIFARELDLGAMGVMLAKQAWLTVVAGAASTALVADALLEYRP